MICPVTKIISLIQITKLLVTSIDFPHNSQKRYIYINKPKLGMRIEAINFGHINDQALKGSIYIWRDQRYSHDVFIVTVLAFIYENQPSHEVWTVLWYQFYCDNSCHAKTSLLLKLSLPVSLGMLASTIWSPLSYLFLQPEYIPLVYV